MRTAQSNTVCALVWGMCVCRGAVHMHVKAGSLTGLELSK